MLLQRHQLPLLLGNTPFGHWYGRVYRGYTENLEKLPRRLWVLCRALRDAKFMARRRRVFAPSVLYHVIVRGNPAKENLYIRRGLPSLS